MAIHAAYNHSLLIGSLEAAAYAKSAQYTASCKANDTTVLASVDLWQTLTPGLKSWSFSLDGVQDYTAGAIDEMLWSAGLFSAPTPMSSMPEGIVDGSLAYFGNLMPSTYQPHGGTVGDLGDVSLSGAGAKYPLVRGLLLNPTANVRTINSSGVQRSLGAVAAGQAIYANLHVVAFSGTSPTLTVKVQSASTADSSFASPTDRITFSTVADLTTPQSTYLPGPITDTRWRATWAITGTAASFNFAVTAGIATP